MSTRFAPQATLHEVVNLISRGDSPGAEKICRDALTRNERDVNMQALLGAVLIKMRRLDEAEKHLREAIRLAPTFAKPHEDLGFLLLERDRPEEAVEILQRAVKLDPKLEFAHFNLGKALAAVGRGKEADVAFERSFELSPERGQLARAAQLHQQGRPEQAEQIYRQVLRRNPDNVDALRLLAGIASEAGRPDESERLLRKAVQIAPDFTGAILDLGLLCKNQDRYEEAIECFRQCIAAEPHRPKTHYLLGATLAPAALTYDAIAAYERALELNPKHAGAWLGLGHCLKTVGRQEDAIDAYRRCAELRPKTGEIWWSLANLKTYRFSEEEIAGMQQRLQEGDLEDISEVNFNFALAKAAEDRGDHDTAWNYYVKGNRKRREMEFYDPVQTEISNNTTIEVFNRELLDEKGGGGNPDPAPIFIVGLPRSGSTLIEQILASHSLVEGTSELPYAGRVALSLNRNRADGINYPEAVRELGPEHFEVLGADYLNYAKMHRILDRPHFIDKMPNNYPYIGFLHLILPAAKIIDARRHPMDACVSCYRQLFARGQNFTYDLTDIGEYYLQYQRMMDHWHDALPGRVLTVQYEEVVNDFEAQVRRIIDYCSLPWEDACLRYYETERPIRTASSEQVRQPIYADSIGQWRRYASHLGELEEILAPILPRYAHLAGRTPS